MTDEQIKDLYVEWSLYEPKKQIEIMMEYMDLCCGYYSRDGFLAFLKDKLQISGYWKSVGLS